MNEKGLSFYEDLNKRMQEKRSRQYKNFFVFNINDKSIKNNFYINDFTSLKNSFQYLVFSLKELKFPGSNLDRASILNEGRLMI